MNATTRMVAIAGLLAWTGCDGAAPPIPLPSGAPLAVVSAQSDTTTAANVVSWHLYVGGADVAAGVDQLAAYGLDVNEQPVAALRVVHNGDAAGTMGTIEFAMYQGGTWAEVMTADLAAQTLTAKSRDVAGAQELWGRLQSDLAYAQANGGIGTQSAGVPYAGCDGCGQETVVAGGACAATGFAAGAVLVGAVTCPETLGIGCVIAVGGGLLAGLVGCAGSAAQASGCPKTTVSQTCDSTKNEVPVFTTCSNGQRLITGCTCADGTVLFEGSCMQQCPNCPCNIVSLDGKALSCGMDFGKPMIPQGGTMAVCPFGTDHVNGSTGYCCPVWMNPPISCVM